MRFEGDYDIVPMRPRPDDPPKDMAAAVVLKDGCIAAVDFSCVLMPQEAAQQHRLGESLYVPEG